ncbi:MAG: biotin/lipoyl-containing protein [Planctomycetota bacterium]
MKYVIGHGGKEYEIEVRDNADGSFELTMDDVSVRADFNRAEDAALCSLLIGQRSYELLLVEHDGHVSCTTHGLGVELAVESERERNARLIAGDHADSGESRVTAVMPGIVVSVAVAPGDEVEKGQPVVVLEAMKMENEIRAPRAGTIAAVHVSPGQTVNGGDPLVEIT